MLEEFIPMGDLLFASQGHRYTLQLKGQMDEVNHLHTRNGKTLEFAVKNLKLLDRLISPEYDSGSLRGNVAEQYVLAPINRISVSRCTYSE